MIGTLKDLQSFLKICRKQGVTDIEFGDMKVKLTPLPQNKAQDDDELDTGGLSDDELIFYSAGGPTV
jgi:hypothetical protein